MDSSVVILSQISLLYFHLKFALYQTDFICFIAFYSPLIFSSISWFFPVVNLAPPSCYQVVTVIHVTLENAIPIIRFTLRSNPSPLTISLFSRQSLLVYPAQAAQCALPLSNHFPNPTQPPSQLLARSIDMPPHAATHIPSLGHLLFQSL